MQAVGLAVLRSYFAHRREVVPGDQASIRATMQSG